MTNTVLGILAHVDAGKTTLSEGILYVSGARRTIGRVDAGNTMLDTHELERERGITIFSSQATFTVNGRPFTLLDTPGHVDFSPETERTLAVLDAAVLVISGTDMVQPHTRTLWRLLSLYQTPVFIFVTKMDYGRYTPDEIMQNLKSEFGDECVSFEADRAERDEQAAMCSEQAMNEFLDKGQLSTETIRELTAGRRLFPVFFGSGLKLQGVREFLDGIVSYAPIKEYPENFGARVFKITHEDDQKIVHMKVTGGKLNVRDVFRTGDTEEKISQIRLYEGSRFTAAPSAEAGQIAAVRGLELVENGTGLGYEKQRMSSILEPVMRYTVFLKNHEDPMVVLPYFRILEEEEPNLRVIWDEKLQEIQVGLMGNVQAEILKSLLMDRFGLDTDIGRGRVLYKETIRNRVEGVGHYEPLRHYAEVHLILEPAARNDGILIYNRCREEILDKNYQRLVLTHLAEKEHLGVIGGFPLTDVKITLTAGRASIKHTEGGDFRQATYRAVRQGLMKAQSVLLEPYFRFRIEIPREALSRAMTDMRNMGGSFTDPYYSGDTCILAGRGPAAELNDYAVSLSSYTSGKGRLLLENDGYDVCHNEDEVRRKLYYIPEADLDNSPDSVFCAHGAGFSVPWQDVEKYMHIESTLTGTKIPKPLRLKETKADAAASDEELEAIMLREFGPIKRPVYRDMTINRADTGRKSYGKSLPDAEILIIDGYNVIFAWEELRELASGDIQAARDRLLHIVSDYAAFKRQETILVFDGYRVPGNRGEQYTFNHVKVVFTKERESGDLYIERLITEIGRRARVSVVTSDGMIQVSALRTGVRRISSTEFSDLVREAEEKIQEIIRRENNRSKTRIGDEADMAELAKKLNSEQ